MRTLDALRAPAPDGARGAWWGAHGFTEPGPRRVHLFVLGLDAPTLPPRLPDGGLGLRWGQDFLRADTLARLAAHAAGRIDDDALRAFLIDRAAAGSLEVDATGFLHPAAALLARLHPEAAFVVDLPPAGAWAEAWLATWAGQARAGVAPPDGAALDRLRLLVPGFAPAALASPHAFAAAAPGLRAALLAHHAAAAAHIDATLPAARRLPGPPGAALGALLARRPAQAAAAPPGAPGAARAQPAPDAAARLELFIASGCNLHCYFCCESDRIAQRRFMPWAEIDAHLVQAAERGVQVLQFMGGEATLHPAFPRALQRARALGMRTFVITNLLRWEDRAFAEAVAPHLDEVMISQHAHGAADGARVTGRDAWWARFTAASANARATLQARVRASTVLDAGNTPDLERIADSLLAFRPEAWVLGSGVPIVGARVPVVPEGNSLTALKALRPRLEALRGRCAAQGCRLVFFCIPQCVLGPPLWDHAHDLTLLDQDLSEDAPSDAASVNFWARPEYRDGFRPVTLARRRGAPCQACVRRDHCGGHFAEYLDAHGEHELETVR